MPVKGHILTAAERATRPQYTPRYDWVLAVAMVDDGMPVARVAEYFGVTSTAVARRLKSPEQLYQEDRERSLRYRNLCPHCRVRNKTRRAASCKVCERWVRLARLRVVGPDEAGLFWPELWCHRCVTWKPMHAFSREGAGVPGRRSECRTCDTEMRRDYRDRTKVPCDICGAPRLSDAEKLPGARSRGILSYPYCVECLQHSDDPRAVSARASWSRRG